MDIVETLRKDKWHVSGVDCERAAQEIERLRNEVHNLNWALGTPGYEQMATPEEQAEHDVSVERVNAMLARLEANKRAHDAMEKDAERYRKVRRGQHWSVINGIGDVLRADDLDAAVDAVPAVGAA